MILLEQETTDWFPGSVHYSVRGELHSQVMFQLKSFKTSAVCWPENRTDSSGACSLEVCFPMRLAGGNILWFTHHYPAQTVSSSLLALISAKTCAANLVTGKLNYREQCLVLSLSIIDYLHMSCQDRLFLCAEWINDKPNCSTYCKLLQDQLPNPKAFTASTTFNPSLGQESTLLMGLLFQISITDYIKYVGAP